MNKAARRLISDALARGRAKARAPHPLAPAGPAGANRLGEVIAADQAFWDRQRRAARGGPKILIATGNGGFAPGAQVDGVLAAALTLRGAEAHFLLCDSALPACSQAQLGMVSDPAKFAAHGPQGLLCEQCYPVGHAMHAPLELPIHRLSQFLRPADIQAATEAADNAAAAEIPAYQHAGLAVGEQAFANGLRYYARGDVAGEPDGERVLRRFLAAAILTAIGIDRLLKRERFAAATVFDGIYVPHGVINLAARQLGLRVANWHLAYRKQCLVFTEGEPRHLSLITEPNSHWEDLTLTDAMEATLMQYLGGRWSGVYDWAGRSFVREQPSEQVEDYQGRQVDFSRPTIGLLTNIIWDAQMFYKSAAFPTMLEWSFRTIEYFAKRPDLQLLIRVHPAEVVGTLPSRQAWLAEAQRAFPTLPPNVYIVPPESRADTYAMMTRCRAGLIYGTKTGIELACLGVPIIVAGQAWVRNKGITRDVASADEYLAELERLPNIEPMAPELVQRARKYAYHFYFRRSIPLRLLESTAGWPPYRLKLDDLRALLPGHDSGLDLICDSLLGHGDFIYPAEHYSSDIIAAMG